MSKLLGVAILAFAVCVSPASRGATWYVDRAVAQPGDGTTWGTAFKTIQVGIGAASHGDTVIAAEGTYVGTIEFRGKNIVLRSTDPLDPAVVAATILDGNDAGNVVRFDGTENATCVLSGFTIRNANGTNGGGVIGFFNEATIENNVITGNRANYGGGISRCDGLIQNNTITANIAEEHGGGIAYGKGVIRNNLISGNVAYGHGGGLYDNRATIRNNTITENTAASGGGLHLCRGEIRGNIIRDNRAEGGSSRGGGLNTCPGLIVDNTIVGNSCTQLGGGLHACDGIVRDNLIRGNWSEDNGGALGNCAGIIERNIIIENWAYDGGGGIHTGDGQILSNLIAGNSCLLGNGYGGGLYVCGGTIVNNTIVGNAGKNGGGFYNCSGPILNCIIWGNTATVSNPQLMSSSQPTYSCIQNWGGGGEGNTSSNPRFADADGPDNDVNSYDDNDYRLLGNLSPCTDSGQNESWMWSALDLDGNVRIVQGVSSITVDKGAYEYRSFVFDVVGIEKTIGGKGKLTWSSRSGDTYSVWSRPGLPAGIPWIHEASVPSGGDATSWEDSTVMGQMKVYRIGIE